MKKMLSGLAIAGLLSVGIAGGASADNFGGSGNGGGSVADANGGAVTIGTVDNGGNAGASVGTVVGDLVLGGGGNIGEIAIGLALGS